MLPADGCQGGSLFSLQPLKPNLTPQRKQLQASSSIRCRDGSCPLSPVVYQPIKRPIWHKQIVMAPAFCACDEQFPSSFNKRSGRSQVALTRLPPERDMIESAKSSSYGVCSHLLLQPARQSSNSARLGSGHQPSCNLTFRGINLCARQTKSRSQHPKEYSNRPRESTSRHTRLVQIQGGWLKQVTVEAKLTSSSSSQVPLQQHRNNNVQRGRRGRASDDGASQLALASVSATAPTPGVDHENKPIAVTTNRR